MNLVKIGIPLSFHNYSCVDFFFSRSICFLFFFSSSSFLKTFNINFKMYNLFFNGFNFFFSNFFLVRNFLTIFLRWKRLWLHFKFCFFELWGLGMRFRVLSSWRRLSRCWLFKIGFSHRVFLMEPIDLRIIKVKKKSDFRRRIFYIFSNNFVLLKYICLVLRYLRGLNVYKFRGFKFQREKIKIKIGKISNI